MNGLSKSSASLGGMRWEVKRNEKEKRILNTQRRVCRHPSQLLYHK